MPPCSSPTLWRTNPYQYTSSLWLDKAPTIFAAQVSAPATFPVAEVPFNNVTTGAYTDIRVGQTIFFGSASGLYDLGIQRVRKAPTSSILYIGRSSQGINPGEVSIGQSSYITVIDQFEIWSRIPFIADGNTVVNGSTPALGVQFKDWDLDFATYGTNGFPQINLGFGPGYIEYVDPNTDTITMSFFPANLSRTHDSSGFTSWLYDIRDGSYVVGGPTSAHVVASFPVGRRVISVTGTDTNGNSTTRYLLVVAMKNGTAYEPITWFDTQNTTLNLNGGQTIDFTVWQSIPASTYYNGGYIVLRDDEWYGSTPGPINVTSDIIGATGSETIKFSGWLLTDDDDEQAKTQGLVTGVTLHGVDAVAKLATLPGFSMTLSRLTSPTDWSQTKNLNLDKYLWFIAHWHSTALFVTDFYDPNQGDTYSVQILGSDADSLYAQMQKLADNAIGYNVACSEQGEIIVRADPLLLDPLQRTSVDIISISQDDIAHIKWTNTPYPRSYWDRGSSILASTQDVGTSPILGAYAIAPGQAPGQGVSNNDRNNQLTTDAQELYRRMGNRRARENSTFSYLDVELIWTGDAGIDPSYQQWVPITLTSQYAAQRNITFTDTRLFVRSVSITRSVSPKGNTKSVKFVGEVETVGLTALPDPQPSTATPTPAQPTITTPAVSGIGNPSHNGGSAVAMDYAKIKLTTTQGAVWTDITGTGLSGNLSQLSLDPFSDFLGVGQAGNLGAWVSTDTGLYYCANILVTSPVWVLMYAYGTTLAATGGILRTDTTVQGGLVASLIDFSNPTPIKRFTGYGATTAWTLTTSAAVDTPIDIGQYGADVVVFGGEDTGTGHKFLYRTINGGAPSVLAGTDIGTPNFFSFVQIPLKTFAGADNSGTGGTQCIVAATVGNGIYKTADGGTTLTSITPSGHPGVGVGGSNSSLVFTTDSTVMAFADAFTNNLFTSTSAGASWTVSAIPIGTSGISSGFFPRQIAGQYALYIAMTNKLVVTPDFGVTFADWTGNWGTVATDYINFIPLY